MFTRIVKMHFKPESINAFKENFEKVKNEVRNQPGCRSVSLYQDKNNPTLFFTYSLWEAEADLDTYRNSDFFKGVWKFTKQLFDKKPQAWSVDELISI